MMKAVRTSETSVYSDETTRRYTPEGSHIRVAPHDAVLSSFLSRRLSVFGQNFLLKDLNSCTSLNVRDQVSRPYEATGEFMVTKNY
jgi:hypothetical protein